MAAPVVRRHFPTALFWELHPFKKLLAFPWSFLHRQSWLLNSLLFLKGSRDSFVTKAFLLLLSSNRKRLCVSLLSQILPYLYVHEELKLCCLGPVALADNWESLYIISCRRPNGEDLLFGVPGVRRASERTVFFWKIPSTPFLHFRRYVYWHNANRMVWLCKNYNLIQKNPPPNSNLYISKQKQIQTVISLLLIPWKKWVIYRFSQEWNGITSVQCFSVGTLQKGELPGSLLSEGQ